MTRPARRYSSTSAARSSAPARAGSVPRSVRPQRGNRGADLVEARPPDGLGIEESPLGLVEVAAQDVAGAGDMQQHRSQRVAGEIVQLAGDTPPLLGDRLFGERFAGLFELVDEHCWRRRTRPRANVNTLADAHAVHDDRRTRDQPNGHQPRHRAGDDGDRTARVGRAEMPGDVEHHHHDQEEGALQLAVASDDSVTGAITSTANSSAGIHGARPRTTNAATAARKNSRSTAEPGSLSWATAMITAALAVKNMSS